MENKKVFIAHVTENTMLDNERNIECTSLEELADAIKEAAETWTDQDHCHVNIDIVGNTNTAYRSFIVNFKDVWY